MLSIKKEIAGILQRELPDMSVEEIEASIEIPSDSSLGDYAFPCFRLAKTLRRPPHVIAGELAGAIGNNELFARTEAVNAYVNMFIDGKWLARITLNDVCAGGDDFGRSDIGGGRPVIVEFSSPTSPNPSTSGISALPSSGIPFTRSSIFYLPDHPDQSSGRLRHSSAKMIVAYRRWGNRADVRTAPISTLLSYYVKFHEEVERVGLDDEAREIFSKLEQQEPEKRRCGSGSGTKASRNSPVSTNAGHRVRFLRRRELLFG